MRTVVRTVMRPVARTVVRPTMCTGLPTLGKMIRVILLATMLLASAAGLPGSGALASDLTGVASVIDGDTLEIHGIRIRLHGIDAPESSQLCLDADNQAWRCGQRAALALSDHIGRAPISCRKTDTDRYGRTIAVCSRGTRDLNAWMVQQGWAVAYRRYSHDYIPHEEAARAAGTGIWSSRFVMPWDWRRGQRIVAKGSN